MPRWAGPRSWPCSPLPGWSPPSRSPPGGAGLVEAALIAGLVGAGGDNSQVAAAVLIYRALTWALPILVGIGCYGWWRRQAWTTPAQGAQPAAGAPQ